MDTATHRSLRLFLGATTAGLAHWFFGNLYEAIIIAPNSMAIIESGRNPGRTLFPRISPTWYYTPLNLLAPLAAGAAFAVGRHDRERRTLLAWTVGGTFVGIGLTAVAVTRVNLKLFVGDHVETDPVRMRALQEQWNVINAARLVSVGVALATAIRALLSTYTAPEAANTTEDTAA